MTCFLELEDLNSYEQIELKPLDTIDLKCIKDTCTVVFVFSVLGAAIMVVGYAQVACLQTAAYNQSQRIRLKLFQSILKQEIGWFDTHESGELNTRLSE